MKLKLKCTKHNCSLETSDTIQGDPEGSTYLWRESPDEWSLDLSDWYCPEEYGGTEDPCSDYFVIEGMDHRFEKLVNIIATEFVNRTNDFEAVTQWCTGIEEFVVAVAKLKIDKMVKGMPVDPLPRPSDCPDLTTEDTRAPIKVGDRLFNYYDRKWGVVGAIMDDGWFDFHHDDDTWALLNGARVATHDPEG